MPREIVAADEKVEKTYLRRMFEALGVKGVAVLVVAPVALGASAVAPDTNPAIFAGVVAVVFALAVVADRHLHPESKVDAVGVSFVLVSAGYAVLLYAGVTLDWTYAVGAAGLVLGAVGYEYLSKGGASVGEAHGNDVDPLHLDIVGFVVAEILVVYAVLHSTGWGVFANSPVFVVLGYIFFVSTVAAFAGYAVITREVVISRTSGEVHVALVSVVNDILDITDDELRKKLALNIRRVAECLDGVRIPTRLEDHYGRIPIVISARKPDARRMEMSVEDVVNVADKTDFTGYVIHGDGVLFFQNGRFVKYYKEGRFLEDAGDIGGIVEDASFYALEYPTVDNLADITPTEDEVVNPAKVVKEMEDKEVDDAVKTGHSLKIGGDEIDVKDMFSITEELVEESPKRGSDGKMLDVGGDEIDIDEIMEKADDVIDELSEK